MSLIRLTTYRFITSPLSSTFHSTKFLNTRNVFCTKAVLFGVTGGSTIAASPYSIINSVGHTITPNPVYNNFAKRIQPNLCRNFEMSEHIRNLSTSNDSKQKPNKMSQPTGRQSLVIKEITKNLTLFANKPRNVSIDPKTLGLKEPTGAPLAIIMSWLLARKKHLQKYAEIYTDLGFDVLVCEITPWQLLWPTKGTQLVAADTIKFLENNSFYREIVLHGFSVGAYQFGEVMVHMSRDVKRYQPILDKISCHIWDSAADITEIPVGLPKAIFPKNMRLQTALRNYTLYHLKTFHNQATVHYLRSSQMFHSTMVKSPALFFVSKNDVIGPPSSNLSVKEDWESANIKCEFKCWEKSGHTAHYIHHKDEYLSLLYKHIENNLVGSLKKQLSAKL